MNNTFASATNLGTGSSGSAASNNTSSTAEVGEPSNHGHTVWAKWTPAVAQTVYFATWQSTESDPKLRTILQVFTGATVSTLTEVTYITEATWKQNYAHWDIGSRIVFQAAAGTTYYIRVDGVGGAEGNFPLVWDTYHILRISACDGCPPQTAPGYACEGAIKMDITTINVGVGSALRTVSFGTMPAGMYSVNYVGGAFIYQAGPLWTVSTNAVQGPHFECVYQVSGTPTTKQFVTYPSPTFYSNQVDTEIAFRCLKASLEHDGGDISLQFYDSPVTDNADGSPSPTFCLYSRVPSFTAVPVSARWTTQGSAATSAFTITNLTDIPWSISATLAASGGVSSPTPATATVPALGSVTVNIPFSASTPNITVTLELTGYFTGPISFGPYYMGPVVARTSSFITSSTSSCSGTLYYADTISLRNTGYWVYGGVSETLNFTTTIVSGVNSFVDAGCALHASPYTYTETASILLNDPFSQPFDLRPKKNTGSSNNAIDVVVVDSGFTIYSQRLFSVTV